MSITERLIERAWAKGDPDNPAGWENWVLEHWPYKLWPEFWYWLFQDMDDIPWINLWSPLRDTYEFQWWIRHRRRWWWSDLWEETRPERIICRFRGHPKGMIFYNPGGYEPDGRCKTCGEDIG